MVDRQAAARQADGRLISLQFRRSLARRLSPRQPVNESNDEPESERRSRSSEVQDISQAVRGLRQGTTLHHRKTARDI